MPILRFHKWTRVVVYSGWAQMLPRSVAARTTPGNQTQAFTPDGVAIEHIVQLCNKVGAAEATALAHMSHTYRLTWKLGGTCSSAQQQVDSG